MRKSRVPEAQVIGMIKGQEAGMPTAEVCRRHRLSPAAFYKLKPKHGGMELTDQSEHDVLAHMAFPHPHRTKLHSTNPIERLNKGPYAVEDAVGRAMSESQHY